MSEDEKKCWERIKTDDHYESGLERLRIDGGWLYKYSSYSSGRYSGGKSMAMCFVPVGKEDEAIDKLRKVGIL